MSGDRVTVLGASGFVGRHLTAHLTAQGVAWSAPGRGDPDILKRDLGHVVYCIGLTADFRRRPYATIDAHVSTLATVLERGDFQSLLYLSSTRVYAGAASTAETAALSVNPNDPSDLYNLSKLTGESLCLTHASPQVRVARLSNVYGFDPTSDNFLPSILRDALTRGRVTLGLSRASEKDYIAVEDVAAALTDIALGGAHRLYNVAAGRNVDNGALLDAITAATGCAVETAAADIRFPPIDVGRLASEFPWRPAPLLERLPELVERYRRRWTALDGAGV